MATPLGPITLKSRLSLPGPVRGLLAAALGYYASRAVAS